MLSNQELSWSDRKMAALSPERGKKLLEQLNFGSVQKDYGFKSWYPEKEGTLAQYEQALEKWHRLLEEIVRK